MSEGRARARQKERRHEKNVFHFLAPKIGRPSVGHEVIELEMQLADDAPRLLRAASIGTTASSANCQDSEAQMTPGQTVPVVTEPALVDGFSGQADGDQWFC